MVSIPRVAKAITPATTNTTAPMRTGLSHGDFAKAMVFLVWLKIPGAKGKPTWFYPS
jgi:hypothetical protein